MSQAGPSAAPNAASPASVSGGLGAHEAGAPQPDQPAPLLGLFQDKRRRREDLRLLLQALNNGWDPPNKRAIMDALHEFIHEPDLNPRFLIRCVWAVVKMTQADLNTQSIVLGMRVDNPRSLTPTQRELRALLKAKPHLRALALQQWRSPE